MWLAKVLGINQDIIQIYHNKNIKLFSKNLVDIALKTSECIEKAKGHHLVFKITISGAESHLPLVTFSNSYLIIGTSEIQLGKLLGLA